ncbi:MAG TPA: phosphate ABC transporter ATP-binding protein PstB [Aggregatilineales bacterium]|nr:phosphate ABC transporter ATP-binding protein PstB [Aggregatilineales bacterium]
MSVQLKAPVTNVPSKPTTDEKHTAQSSPVKVKNLRAFYGRTMAIDGISLDFQPNIITALIGPSGCGKSTLLRCLNRMHEVIKGAYAEGEVLLDDQNIYASDADPVRIRRRIGMVFQKPNPFPTMSIYENVIAGYKLNNGTPRGVDFDEIVESALRSVALWDEVKDKLKASGTDLSGGQQQRLCIARTIAVNPDVVLLDEPCSALDPIATLKVEELLQELRNRYTIILVTHNMQQAARVSDYTAFLLADEKRVGKMIEFGQTAQIFTRPTDKRTEDYISGRFG